MAHISKIKIAGIPDKARNTGMPYYTTDNRITVEALSNVNPPTEEEITTTAKPIDRKDATIEAEVGEVIAKPGLTALHKVGGKKHSKGGTPLSPLPGSFIFSDDKNLAITDEEKELFKFKEGGSTSKKDNTPAKILKKEIDIKAYNSFIATLNDPDKDPIAKTTAALMLAKYQEKLGQIGFLQEFKKNEPIPDFSEGTEPYENPEMNMQEDEQLMYKKGGKYPDGGYPGSKPRKGQIAKGLQTGFNKFNAPWLTDFGYSNDWKGVNQALGDLGFGSNYTSPYYPDDKYLPTPNMNNVGRMQQFLVDQNFQQGNYSGFNNLMGNYGLTNQGVAQGLKPEGFQINVNEDTPIGGLYQQFVDNKFGVRSLALLKDLLNKKPPTISVPNNPRDPMIDPPTDVTNPNTPVAPPITDTPTAEGPIPSLGYDIKGKLTNAQQANLAYLGYQAMNVKRYMPMRQQVDLPEVNLDTINEQPLVNAVNNQTYAAQRLASTNPRTAALNASNIYGKSIDALSQVYGNVNNQNVQIGNQENLTNLQQATNQVMTNTQLDAKYYDQTIASKENYDREKRFAQNQFASTLNQYQSQADQLAWALASVNKYGNRKVIDKKTGKIYNQPTPLYEYTSDGIRYNADVASLDNASGADRVNSINELQKIMQQFGINPTDSKQMYAFSKFYEAITGRGKQPVYQNSPVLPQ